jgi:hypothetical protein
MPPDIDCTEMKPGSLQIYIGVGDIEGMAQFASRVPFETNVNSVWMT